MYPAAVITVSDKGSRGERKDESRPVLCDLLVQYGYQVVYTSIVPDDANAIQKELLYCSDEANIPLVLTTGGTGFSPQRYHPRSHYGCC